MTTKEKKIIVKALLVSFLSMKLEEEEDSVVWKMINELVPDPEFSDYIFYSTEFYDEDDNLDIAGVIKKGFEYKPIAL